ncbi:carbohydrate ABC transporter permease [Paenarthrobacter aurescens]|uniref:Sugar ABC transporter permease n=1 Tax=Paenarthrobacter aurescens TaxID=43663 RepID=A0A4Y3NFY1_PAEAU|nr:carbohydrate ABC transporter permease [Paenarthrobacter aurescens]UKA50395.1 carbohydrate ABC transporter permease [Arthrobacter sp. FW305-123]MDO6145288.1 carbohydrate ABC transporter permease [Paenarthrobacter aurescens]MDO6145943.1 carbohydrate ABC transporter permease [Paenarthrobacter aurescens]MDO6157187.1 carbohydrate ABC transporter permease [Paenarthrobacter aurescens]MDO6161172.1 carbohydrate ABC transporter permease [Paenarthrobacter aurescens]
MTATPAPKEASKATRQRPGSDPTEDAQPIMRRVKTKLTSKWATAAAIIIAVVWSVPTVGLFITSLRPAAKQVGPRSNGWWNAFVDWDFTLKNYVDVLTPAGSQSANLSQYFVNSIAIVIPVTIFVLVLASMAAYVFAWGKFKGRDALFIFVFALQIIPLQMALIPLLQFFTQTLNLPAGSYAQLWIAHTMFGLPLGIFLLHNFISEIPGEVIEAARVDGAGHSTIFWRIILPLSVPALASLAIFQFLWVWNDLLVALVFSGGTADVAPITQRLAEISGTRGARDYLNPAAAFVSIIIPLLVFFGLQRYFVRGLLSGGLKG